VHHDNCYLLPRRDHTRVVADEPSRRAATVWGYYLHRRIFETLELILLGERGAVTFDLCASMANAQTEKYALLPRDCSYQIPTRRG
jgi:hypothetical protein